MVLKRFRAYGSLVMFSHTLFSLPFGIIAMLWAYGGLPSTKTIFWVFTALIAARNGANAFNRIADKDFDRKNPRTSNRHIPSGKVSLTEAYLICAVCFILLGFSAFMLSLACFLLFVPAVALFIFYSYSKRITWLCHYILGLCCGGAPVGAWLAVTQKVPFAAIILGAAVCTWVAGFDIIYSLQDMRFDQTEGLYSIPARFGLKNALLISGLSHIITVGLFFLLFLINYGGAIYLAGVFIISSLLFIEHVNIIPENRNKIIFASYSINQIISIIFFVFSLADFAVMY